MAAFSMTRHAEPGIRRAFAALVFLLALGSAFAQSDASSLKAEEAAAKDGTQTRFQGWEVRYGVAGGVSALAEKAQLIGKAESFAVDVFKFRDEASGENRILGVGEAHGLFPVPLESAVAIVLDYPNLKRISPRVREVRVLDASAFRYSVYEDIGINFMGISIGYRLEAETLRDNLAEGIVGVRSRLTKSLDGKLYASDASWYFRRMEIGGLSYTYMRTWTTSGLRNPAAGVAGIMKLFTAGELRDQVNAVASLAAKR